MSNPGFAGDWDQPEDPPEDPPEDQPEQPRQGNGWFGGQTFEDYEKVKDTDTRTKPQRRMKTGYSPDSWLRKKAKKKVRSWWG